MVNLIYLTLNGEKQELISAGCCSLDSIGNKAQLLHLDHIMVYELTHGLNRDQNVNHHSVTIKNLSIHHLLCWEKQLMTMKY